MENSPIGWTHKVQIGATLAILGLLGLAYLIYGLTQGFDITNQHILNNKLTYGYLFLIAIAIVPVYSDLEHQIAKIAKQAGWTGSLLLVGSVVFWIAYGIGEPPKTALGLILYRISFIIGPIAFFSSIVSLMAPSLFE